MMVAKKLSLKGHSEQVGVPPSTIHGWLNGAGPKSLVDLKKIADLFKVSIDELCFGITENSILTLRERVVGDLGSVELVLRVKD